MKFLVEINDIEAMKDEICNVEGEDYRSEIDVYDYIELIDSCLNMFDLGAKVELIKNNQVGE